MGIAFNKCQFFRCCKSMFAIRCFFIRFFIEGLKMTVRLFWVLVFAGFFWGCFSDGGSYPAEGIPSSDVHRQMLLVEGSKDTVTLGTSYTRNK
jgi:hypothetical protein